MVCSSLVNQILPVLSLPSNALLFAKFPAADFQFASYIHDHMVLQKEPAGAVIWGYGTPGATVTVTLHQDQEVIMKKVTPVKGKADPILCSAFVFFCHLLDCLRMKASFPAQAIHPSTHPEKLSVYCVLGTEDTKKTKTEPSGLFSRS